MTETFRNPDFISPRFYTFKGILARGEPLTAAQMDVIKKYQPIHDRLNGVLSPPASADPNAKSETEDPRSPLEPTNFEALKELFEASQQQYEALRTTQERLTAAFVSLTSRVEGTDRANKDVFLVTDRTGLRADQYVHGWKALEDLVHLKESTMRVKFSLGEGSFKRSWGGSDLTITKVKRQR